MAEATLVEELAFVMEQQQKDEATVLAQAIRAGIRALYRDALIEAYLIGRISRQEVLKRLGSEVLEEIEYQRDALKRDVAWGLGDA
ncbi:MAG: hypothetical protein NUW24_14985 [Anaerolineae bacterium]|jgi:hypothetical protein|nr:hypothetical protein [Anaerolineae bacterium]MDH7475422.1 hypothetical protein [Anaerolineae bacterium]